MDSSTRTSFPVRLLSRLVGRNEAHSSKNDEMRGASPFAVARAFHEEYERLAPQFGYETRERSAVPWADVPLDNKRLMVATAKAVLAREELALTPGSPGVVQKGERT